MKMVLFPARTGHGVHMAVHFHLPHPFDTAKLYLAVVVVHPTGDRKEQIAGSYAKALAAKGFVALAYDASFQGESGGDPRLSENPHIRVEDVSAVVDYLLTLPYVDSAKIAAIGVAEGGGYAVNAATIDHRIAAVIGISIVNIGQALRKGWDGSRDEEQVKELLTTFCGVRADDVGRHGTSACLEIAPFLGGSRTWDMVENRVGADEPFGRILSRSMMQLINYDAFHMADVFLSQPLLLLIGSVAENRWMSEDLYRLTASRDKHIFAMESAGHLDLCCEGNFFQDVICAAVSFLNEKLSRRSREDLEACKAADLHLGW